MKKRISLALYGPLILFVLSDYPAWAQGTQEHFPVIDMHLHAHTLRMYGAPPPEVCTNDRKLLFLDGIHSSH
jgi:hypothetical protein